MASQRSKGYRKDIISTFFRIDKNQHESLFVYVYSYAFGVGLPIFFFVWQSVTSYYFIFGYFVLFRLLQIQVVHMQGMYIPELRISIIFSILIYIGQFRCRIIVPPGHFKLPNMQIFLTHPELPVTLAFFRQELKLAIRLIFVLWMI